MNKYNEKNKIDIIYYEIRTNKYRYNKKCKNKT